MKYCLMALMALVSSLLVACSHIDLVDEVASNRLPVRVVFDWTGDPGARPEEMTLYVYRTGLTRTVSPYVFDFDGRDGGLIALPPGTYAAICHNSDSDRHGFVGTDSYMDFGLSLNTVRTSGMGSAYSGLKADGDERLAHSPDSIWVGALDAFVVPTKEVMAARLKDSDRGDGDPAATVVSMPMQSVVHHFRFIIHHPVNLPTTGSVVASVSGMPSTVHPGRGLTGEETVSHSFGMRRTVDGSLCGELLTFGHCSSKPLGIRGVARADDSDEILHMLKVQATHSNGQLTTSLHDVTRQIHEYGPTAPGGGMSEMIVELDTVVLPPPDPGTGSGTGGFNPTVQGWTGTQEGLGM